MIKNFKDFTNEKMNNPFKKRDKTPKIAYKEEKGKYYKQNPSGGDWVEIPFAQYKKINESNSDIAELNIDIFYIKNDKGLKDEDVTLYNDLAGQTATMKELYAWDVNPYNLGLLEPYIEIYMKAGTRGTYSNGKFISEDGLSVSVNTDDVYVGNHLQRIWDENQDEY